MAGLAAPSRQRSHRRTTTQSSMFRQPVLTREQIAAAPLQARLSAAIMADNVTDMRAALSAGASVDLAVESFVRMTPICVAAQHGKLNAVKCLIERGASLLAAKHAHSPLLLAAKYGHLAVFEVLWTNGASRDAHERTGETLLHAAASAGSIPILERIKSDDSAFFAECLEAEDEQSCTPLTFALIDKNVDVAFWLVAAGANINASGAHPDSSVLRWALVCPHTAFFDMLLAHPQFDPSPVTPPEFGRFLEIILVDAAIAGLVRSVDFLLTHTAVKADCICTQLGGGPVVLVATCERCASDTVVDIVILLIKHGAKVEDPNCDDDGEPTGFRPRRRSALVGALCAKTLPATKQALVTLLLRAGANVAREAVLVAALENLCSVELAQRLVDAGAPPSMAAIFAGAEAGASAALLDVVGDAMEPPLDVNAKSARGDTLLHFSQLGCEVLARLIDAGADIDARNVHGFTPLMMVPEERDAEFFLLLERGANPRATNHGFSILHHAASLGCPERVRRLLAAGVSAKCLDGLGKTALFKCVEPESVRLLVAAGASPIQFLDGKTAVSSAFRKPDVLRTMLSFCGNFAGVTRSLLMDCLRHKSVHSDETGRDQKVESFAENDVIAACVQILIDAGAGPSNCSVDGVVPLHIAVQQANGRRPICVLLRNGAIDDLERQDSQRRAPRDFAEESRLGRGRPRLNATDVDKHDGVLMLVAMGVEPLPTWVEPLSSFAARKQIQLCRFELVRQRATDVLIVLQALSLSALEMVHIIEALSPVDGVPFELSWKLATTVKHFKSKSKSNDQ